MKIYSFSKDGSNMRWSFAPSNSTVSAKLLVRDEDSQWRCTYSKRLSYNQASTLKRGIQAGGYSLSRVSEVSRKTWNIYSPQNA